MSDTFGALSEVQFLHSICRFEAQEVKNPILQTVRNLELKWRSYSHFKLITLSWRKNFAKCCDDPFCCEMISQPFCTVLCFPLEVSRHDGSRIPQIEWPLRNAARLAVCCEVISQPFLCLCEISQTSFSLAKWSLVRPDICYRHWEIFFIRFLLSKSQNSPWKPPIIRFLSF